MKKEEVPIKSKELPRKIKPQYLQFQLFELQSSVTHYLNFMIHIRPELNYAEHALEPFISAETLQYHSGKHHQTYVDNLNRLIVGTPHENQALEETIRSSQGAIFNNAAQVWNHTFYFENLAPAGTTEPSSELSHSLNQQWGSID